MNDDGTTYDRRDASTQNNQAGVSSKKTHGKDYCECLPSNVLHIYMSVKHYTIR